MAPLAPCRALAFGLALALAACGPPTTTTRTTYTPRPRAPAFRAGLADTHGAEVACDGDGSVGCVLYVASLAAGRYRLRVERDATTLEGDLGLRGSERAVAVYWLAPEPAAVLRVQRAPAALTLSLPTLDPHREWARQLPVVVLSNGTPATLRGAGWEDNFFGTLFRRDEWGRWEQVGGRVGCATVMPGFPLHAGASVEVEAPDFIGGRGAIVEEGRYRFDLSVRVADPADWDRYSDAFGTTPLESADDPAFAVADVIDLSLELTGTEILASQPLAPTPTTSATEPPP